MSPAWPNPADWESADHTLTCGARDDGRGMDATDQAADKRPADHTLCVSSLTSVHHRGADRVKLS